MANNTLEENITQAISDFGAIKNAIISKGVEIPNNTPTSSYANLIRSINIRNAPNFTTCDEWLLYGGLESSYGLTEISELISDTRTNLTGLGGKTIYEYLLSIEASAAYAAYIQNSIANAIKSNPIALRKALICNNKYMFLNSSKNFEEDIDAVIETNDYVTENNYQGIVTCSSDRNSDPNNNTIADDGYYCWMAFNGGRDSSDVSDIFSARGVWSAFGENQWVQYKYNSQKYLYKVRVYSLRDNAPIGVKIEGSNDGENFTLIKEQSFEGIVGAEHYEEIICCEANPYQYFRFTIPDNIYSGTCGVGEIEIYTFKES